MRLFLIGPMGAGKSEVGREVSRLLGMPFRDTDELVEERMGMTVEEVFRFKGEAAFRDEESEVVRELAAGDEAEVVACGGGVVLRADNVEALRSGGLVVYLRVSPQEAARRIGGTGGRPLLQGAEDVTARLRGIMEEREVLYRRAAHAVVDTDGKRPREVAEEVVRLWRAYG